MEDVLTEIPPPSRFFQEDLNNFTPPMPPLPSPFLLFSNPKANQPLRPALLIIGISSPSLYVFHHLSSKTLIGSLILPEIPFSANSVEPSLGDKSCNIYNLNHDAHSMIVLVSVQCPVAAERSHIVAKLLIGEQILPERVLILDSVQSRNFRGKLSPDETFAFKLETSLERKGGSSLLKNVEHFPSGSVVDGLAAALLSRCQMRNIKGTLCVSWPEFGIPAVSLLSAMQHLEQKLVQGNRMESKREFTLENIRKEQVRVTLWSEAARSFDQQAVEVLSPPVMIVFTSLKVKEFQGKPVLSSTQATSYFLNPEIAELPLYKTVVATATAPIQVIPPSGRPQMGSDELREENRKSIKQLRLLDPNTNTACPICYKQLKPSHSGLSCLKHMTTEKPPVPWYKVNMIIEDHTDEIGILLIGKAAENFFGISCHALVLEQGYDVPYTLPPIMKQMIGRTNIFQLHFGNFRNDLSQNDLLVSAVFYDILAIEHQNTTPVENQLLLQTKDVPVENVLPATPIAPPRVTPHTPLTAPFVASKQKKIAHLK